MKGPETDLLRVFDRREPLLRAVRERPSNKCDLTDALDVSRSTVDRSVRELERADVVERGPDGYRLTLRGDLLFEAYERLVRRLRSVDTSSAVLSGCPPDVDVDVAMLDGAEVVRAMPEAPFGPADRHLEFVREADRIRLVGAAILPTYVRTYRDRIVTDGAEAEVVLPSGVIQRLLADHREAFTALLESGRLSLREVPDRPPYSLSVLDLPDQRRAGLLVYVAEGPRGYLSNASPEAVEWAERTFESYWESADPISP